jgi:hypothetical protein
MQTATDSAPSSTASSFAGLLAALTAPKSDSALPPLRRPDSAWDDDGLADDVATLSYENALRARTRYRALQSDRDRTDRSLTGPDPNPDLNRNPVDSYELAPLEELPPPPHASAAPARLPVQQPGPAAQRAAAPLFDRNLKSASVTIRLSQEEATQLHRRAAEAGLTVSAYLRSCTFEAESLRALVKDTMAQLRAATAQGKEAPAGSSGPGWMARLLTPWRTGHRMARA